MGEVLEERVRAEANSRHRTGTVVIFVKQPGLLLSGGAVQKEESTTQAVGRMVAARAVKHPGGLLFFSDVKLHTWNKLPRSGRASAEITAYKRTVFTLVFFHPSHVASWDPQAGNHPELGGVSV